MIPNNSSTPNESFPTVSLDNYNDGDLALYQKFPGIYYRCMDSKRENIIFLSNEAQNILGFTLEELKGTGDKRFNAHISEKEKSRINNTIQESLNLKNRFSLTYSIEKNNKEITWVTDSGSGKFDSNGNLLYIEGWMMESQRLSQKVREYLDLTKWLSFYLDNIPMAVIEYDLNNKILDWNKAAESTFEYTKEEAIGKDFFDLIITTNVKEEIGTIIQKLKQNSGGYINVNENLTKSKGKIICEWFNTPIIKNGEVIAIISMAQDITDRVLQDETLKSREELFRALSEQSIFGMFLFKDENIIFANEGCAKLFETPTSELVRLGIFNIIEQYMHPDDKNNFIKQYDSRTKGNRSNFEIKYRIILSDGKIKWIHQFSKPIDTEFGVLIQGILMDITNETQTYHKLQESELKFRSLADQSFIGINVTQDGLTKYCNRASELITGYSFAERNEWEKDKNLQIIHPDDYDKTTQFFNEDHASGNSEQLFEYTYRIITKSGSIKWVEDYSKRILFNEREAWLTFLLDVTDKRKMEEDIIKSQKLESIGILAGGIAHDFNNLLTSIIGNLSIALLEVDEENSSLREIITEAEKACIQAAQLTKQLLTFSKGGAPIKKSTSLKNILEDTTSFLLRGTKFSPEFDIQDDLYLARVDVSQVSQVIQNLVLNAKQAMPHGGRIRIIAQNLDTSINLLDPGLRKDRKYVKISIQDTGIGIPKEFLPKIFDPYFTTKETGSGLGLAMCYSIIKKHDGLIRVESEIGVGTTFYIYLPALNL